MKRMALIGALSLATAGLVSAQEKPLPIPHPQQPQEKMLEKTVVGKITSVDAEADTIRVNTLPDAPKRAEAHPEQRPAAAAEMTFTVNEESTIVAHGPEKEEIELEDLEVGDQVNVKYVLDPAGQNLAKSIQVVSKTRPTE